MRTNLQKSLVVLTAVLLPFGAWAQSADDDFFGDDAPTVTEAPASKVDPTKAFTESAEGLKWSGSVTSSASWAGGWVDQWPDATDPTAGWKDGLDYGLSTKLGIDARPDPDFRFHLVLKTGYPFTTDQTVVNSATYSNTGPTFTSTSTTIKTPNIAVWEMFTDVTINDTLFLRFGKQSASWGVSYFYSPGDVISLTAKDASDPTAEREGPMALKATLPFPGLKANLTGFVLARDTYFGDQQPTLADLGYALQADALVGQAQVSLGGFYQKDNAPKAVATLNTGLGFLKLPVVSDLNVFSEAVFSYGSDYLKVSGTDSGILGPVWGQVSTWDKKVYYTGTVGASYSNSDANLTLRAEYLYNPFGSTRADAAERGYNTVIASLAGKYGNLAGGSSSASRDFGFGDALTPAQNNLTALASLSKVFGSDKLSFSTLWQQNLDDKSGWVKPTFSLQAFDQLSFTWGITTVYGDEGTQFPLLMQAYDADQNPLGTKRVTLNLGVTFGTSKY